jgi:hypothetical protein
MLDTYRGDRRPTTSPPPAGRLRPAPDTYAGLLDRTGCTKPYTRPRKDDPRQPALVKAFNGSPHDGQGPVEIKSPVGQGHQSPPPSPRPASMRWTWRCGKRHRRRRRASIDAGARGPRRRRPSPARRRPPSARALDLKGRLPRCPGRPRARTPPQRPVPGPASSGPTTSHLQDWLHAAGIRAAWPVIAGNPARHAWAAGSSSQRCAATCETTPRRGERSSPIPEVAAFVRSVPDNGRHPRPARHGGERQGQGG